MKNTQRTLLRQSSPTVLALLLIGLILSIFATTSSSVLAQQALKADRPIKDKWALVIGVNEFEDPTIPTLQYSAKDAKDFANFLITKGNFARDHVLVLLNQEATDDNIKRALGDNWLPRRVFPDDLVVIYVSTHGSPKEIDVAQDNFLIAYNTHRDSLFSSGLRLKDLSRTVKERTGCDRIVLLLDACNSGAAEAGGKGLYRAANFDIGAVAGEGQVIISSSSADQRSWESKRYQNGVFTKNLIDSLSLKGAVTTIDEAFEQLKDSVMQEVRFDRKASQTPLMKSKWTGNQLALLAPPVRPRSTEPYIVKQAATQSRHADQNSKSTATISTTKAGNNAPQVAINPQSSFKPQIDKPTKFYETGLRFAKIKDFKQAFTWYQKAAALGHAAAQGQVGALLISGTGIDQNGDQGVKWLTKAAEAGDKSASALIGSLYLTGHYVNKDPEKALSYIRGPASEGNAQAQYLLGCMYLTGTGVEKSKLEALNWL